MDPTPKGSFERTYDNEEAEQVANEQSYRQTSLNQISKERDEIHKYNRQKMEEFKADNSEMLHDDTFDLKQFEKEVRQEIA